MYSNSGITQSSINAINKILAEEKEKDYKKFFMDAMKKFKVKSPAELSDDDKKKFFTYIDKNWKGKFESVDLMIQNEKKACKYEEKEIPTEAFVPSRSKRFTVDEIYIVHSVNPWVAGSRKDYGVFVTEQRANECVFAVKEEYKDSEVKVELVTNRKLIENYLEAVKFNSKLSTDLFEKASEREVPGIIPGSKVRVVEGKEAIGIVGGNKIKPWRMRQRDLNFYRVIFEDNTSAYLPGYKLELIGEASGCSKKSEGYNVFEMEIPGDIDMNEMYGKIRHETYGKSKCEIEGNKLKVYVPSDMNIDELKERVKKMIPSSVKVEHTDLTEMIAQGQYNHIVLSPINPGRPRQCFEKILHDICSYVGCTYKLEYDGSTAKLMIDGRPEVVRTELSKAFNSLAAAGERILNPSEIQVDQGAVEPGSYVESYLGEAKLSPMEDEILGLVPTKKMYDKNPKGYSIPFKEVINQISDGDDNAVKRAINKLIKKGMLAKIDGNIISLGESVNEGLFGPSLNLKKANDPEYAKEVMAKNKLKTKQDVSMFHKKTMGLRNKDAKAYDNFIMKLHGLI